MDPDTAPEAMPRAWQQESIVVVTLATGAMSNRDLEAVDRAMSDLRAIPTVSVSGWDE